ncbi:hypothetical protein [Nocardioides sp. NPDC004968]|uniref:hypothetical protein n=1 Tax=Nocardioides sp. NPDC004968 TaxID=3155894 RepID=UPI0033AC165B
MITLIVAGMGLTATLAATWLSGEIARRKDWDIRVLEAKLRLYGECAEGLYEYLRVCFDRCDARIRRRSEAEREPRRIAMYGMESNLRAVIGQLAIISGDEDLLAKLEQVRESIRQLGVQPTEMDDLNGRRLQALEEIDRVMRTARADMTRPYSRRPTSGSI